MYVKPHLVRFGSVRDLTQIGFDQDCDGGLWGISSTSGTWWKCEDSRS